MRQAQALQAGKGLQVDIGIELGLGRVDAAVGRVQALAPGQHVRAQAQQARGQRRRQGGVGAQRQPGAPQRVGVARRLARQRGQRVALARDLAVQRVDLGIALRQAAARLGDRDVAAQAGLAARLVQVQQLALPFALLLRQLVQAEGGVQAQVGRRDALLQRQLRIGMGQGRAFGIQPGGVDQRAPFAPDIQAQAQRGQQRTAAAGVVGVGRAVGVVAGVAIGADAGAGIQRRLARRVGVAERGFGLAQPRLRGADAGRLPLRIGHQAVELIVAPGAPPGRAVVGRVADGGGDVAAGIQRGGVQGLAGGPQAAVAGASRDADERRQRGGERGMPPPRAADGPGVGAIPC
ncbi:Uncharacterised protein [Achromobacter sp. 2789STDY5608621]|nr:Uncharacterised protein [Achromobacter sp. 2789STDY5608621]